MEQENDTDGTETSGGQRTTRREAGMEPACNEEETSEAAGVTMLAEKKSQTQANKLAVSKEQTEVTP